MTEALANSGPEIPTHDEHGRRVQAMFSDIAHGYDRANRVMSAGTDVRWRRKAVASLLPADGAEAGSEATTGAGARILDLCAGTLDSTLEIHRRYPEAELVGGDFSAGMLETGMRRIAALGDPKASAKIRAERMDAHALPLDDASVDAIFCAFGVRNLSDLELASAEQLRCLRPGGRLVILDFFRPTAWTTRAFHAVYNRTVLPLVGWACTGNLDAYLYLPRSIGNMRAASDYVALLAEIGFEDVSVEALTFGVASIVRATKPASEADARGQAS
ncbi:Demethylmenaquinone methyltransferase [Enhygromyxa salina]|uniref:Demethylmenaquinone methyltransferase n=1 Tax=Enhygromyxa salina TaxID=215803 RepID=A0A2S9YKS9_9BACT|nr:ubiquinone/menaquinone biosynthesis methyltransferase [Enhygromyxa salina]PRQ05703.1 Demethylmenaquinone methyltransferase [Enhygromyxa salina]